MKTLAALASIPGRPLETVLRSLRPQVDALAVYLNGYAEIPAAVRELGCQVVLDPTNRGAARKLYWADQWDGRYFACDDDLDYPPDYVARLSAELDRWGPGVIVTACGRTMHADAIHWRDWEGEGRYAAAVPAARWINYAGACAFAFDARLGVPTDLDPPNDEEAALNVWAQRHQVPIRLLARPADWPRRLPVTGPTLFQGAKATGFATRDHLIASIRPWRVHEPAGVLV